MGNRNTGFYRNVLAMVIHTTKNLPRTSFRTMRDKKMNKPLTKEKLLPPLGHKVLTIEVEGAVRGLKEKISGKYPKDLFPEITKKQYLRINELLLSKMHMSLDRLSANLMRRKERIDLQLVDEWFSAFAEQPKTANNKVKERLQEFEKNIKKKKYTRKDVKI